MKNYISKILFFLLFYSFTFAAVSQENKDTIPMPKNGELKWYSNLKRDYNKNRKLDEHGMDSVMNLMGKDYWKWAAVHGRLNLKDSDIEYPSFVKLCVDVYNWGDRTFNSYDSAYVVGTGYKWKAIIKNDNWLDNYWMRVQDKTTIGMLSNLNSNIGFSLAFMAVSAGYMFDFDNIFAGKAVTHKRWDFNFCCSLIAFDLYYSKNRGGTNIVKFGDYGDNDKRLDMPFKDLRLESYGVDAYYFFNNKKYSQGAAYNFSKFQKKSAGSFIAGITISAQDVSMDFSQLPQEMIDQLPNKSITSYRFRYNDYCFLLGYGYNFVLSKHWLLNLSGLPSIGLKHCMKTSIENRKKLFSYNLKGKMSIIYNRNRLFAGFVGKIDAHWYYSKQYSLINAVENLNVCAGYRF